MKYKMILWLLWLLPMSLLAQDYVFFDDSPNSSYYDPSFGYYSNPSFLILANTNKFPVDVVNKYSGTNSLKLLWRSNTGGDWGLAVASEGWTPRNVTLKDSLIFQVFAPNIIDSSALPVIYLEDTQNRKTVKQSLSDFIGGLEEDKWIRVSIPLDPFIQNPGTANLTDIKTIYFGQDRADSTLHLIYIDEIRMITGFIPDDVPPAMPTGLTAESDFYFINLDWASNTEDDLLLYRIYRAENGGDYSVSDSIYSPSSTFKDFPGPESKTYSYRISAVDLSGNESELSSEVTASTIEVSDSALLDIVQEASFKYFWDYAHPVSGLARERYGSGETVTTGGSGFGVMTIPVGIERGFITRGEGVTRMLKILNFLTATADRFHGAFPHWMNGTNGNVIPFGTKDNGGDLVETAFMIQGLLACRQYFNQNTPDELQIRSLATQIWENVEWDWYRKDPNSNYLYWHWSPNYNWEMNFRLQGPNETMICYLLGIASPTHPIPASMYKNGWASSGNYKNGKSFYGIPLYVGWDYGGPLFFAHYSFLGFDPRNKKDAYANYFINNRNHSLIHQAYSMDNPHNFEGYDADTWGLTASDDPFGYMAHEPSNDNGTISPTAALSSMPYTPEESMAALKSFFYEYGNGLWGEYGFKDAFNPEQDWYANSYLAIDQGPIIVMIENYRTQLLWNNFMANPEIQPMLDAIGFVYDSTSTDVDTEPVNNNYSFSLRGNYPNPFNPSTKILYTVGRREHVTLKVHDILGREVAVLVNEEKNPGEYEIVFDSNNYGSGLANGVYIYSIKAGSYFESKKIVLLK